MTPAAAGIFLAIVFNVLAYSQTNSNWKYGPTPASPGWPFGPPHSLGSFEGLLLRSDGETLSIDLHDQRVIRFRLDGQTRYKPDGPLERLTDFHQADVVAVESEVDAKGYLVAHSVRFTREASPEERAEILQNPEVMQQWRENVIGAISIDPAQDDRKLSFAAKPKAIAQGESHTGRLAEDDTIAMIRRTVNQAFDWLPNLRAKQVTSLFHSSSKPIKWVPDNVVAAEIAYEDGRESYSDIHIDGKRPNSAPYTGDSEYMRSLDKTWSTGDFKTISHCIFSELEDSDFHQIHAERSVQEDLAVYEFSGRRASTCIAVQLRSQIAYPAFKGLLKVRAQTGEVLHVELEAIEMPSAFPLDRAERSVDFDTVEIGGERYLLPVTGYWFGCLRNSYSCFLNRIDFRDYRRFGTDSIIRFDK